MFAKKCITSPYKNVKRYLLIYDILSTLFPKQLNQLICLCPRVSPLCLLAGWRSFAMFA
jgi:hypothetical protein